MLPIFSTISMRRFFHKTCSKGGFSLVEVVLYVGLFTALSLMSMTSLFQTVKAFNNLRISRDIDDSSVKIMERLTRDIKSSTAVDLAKSTFGSTPGRLTLSTVNASGTPLIVEYYVATSSLRIKENGVDVGPLMSGKTSIEALVFRYINTGNTLGIKTELYISSTRSSLRDADNFYNTSLIRGSY